MLARFDYYDRYTIPIITLCNPNRFELGQLSQPLDLNIILRFNSTSEISFKYPYRLNDDTISPLYNELVSKRILYLREYGYFIIQDNQETDNGVERYKEITALSCEIELSYRKLNLFSGTYKFYDPVNPANTLLGAILEYLPNWTAGSIAPELQSKYRTFEVNDNTIYNFLMTDVEESYECIFTFDTFNRKINADTLRSVVSNTDIYIDYANLSKETQLEEVTTEIATVMACYGGDNLDISSVNPLGSNYIYNFNYFKPMMSSGLVLSLNNWENKVASYSVEYTDKILTLKTLNTDLITQQTKLNDLKAKVLEIEGVQSAQIQQGIDKTDPETYAITVTNLANAENEVSKQTVIVDELTIQITNLKSQIVEINKALQFSENFTSNELAELDNYKFESTYQNDTFIVTDVMDLNDKLEIQQNLYDQCVSLLTRLSQLKFNFEIDSVNFLFIKAFQPFISQLKLGSCLNVEIHKREYITPILLEIEFNYDNPDDFSMTFGNRYRLDDQSWQFSDLYQSSTKAGSTVDFNGSAWTGWTKQQTTVEEFINSSLDLTKNALINNATNQSMVMNQNGLKGKKVLEDGSFDGKQIWLTNNIIAFTDDNFQTVRTVVGEVVMPDGSVGYGIGGETIIGNLIFGSTMTISNNTNTILMDEQGFVMTTDDGKGRVLLSPSNGIKIQSRTNTSASWSDKFYVDSDGNALFEGTLVSTSGTIGGFNISNTTLTSTNVGIGSATAASDSTWAFWAGSNTAASAPFRVSHTGTLYSTSAVISGNVAMTSGTIGGWTINSSGLTDATGANYIYPTKGQLGGANGIWWDGPRGGIGNDTTWDSNGNFIFEGSIKAYSIVGGSRSSGGWVEGKCIGGTGKGTAADNPTTAFYSEYLDSGQIESDDIYGAIMECSTMKAGRIYFKGDLVRTKSDGTLYV